MTIRYVLLPFFFLIIQNGWSQVITTEQIKEYTARLNQDLPFEVPGSGGVILKSVASFRRDIFFNYEVPENWIPFEDAQELTKNTLSEKQKKFYAAQKINLNFSYERNNLPVSNFRISYDDLGLPEPSSLGDYISYHAHPKSKGVNFKIKDPLAFEKLEGDRPNIVGKFNNKDLNLVYTFGVRKLPIFFSKDEVIEFIFGEGHKKMAENDMKGSDIELLFSHFTTVDRYPAVSYIYDFDRVLPEGQVVTSRMINWTVYYEDRIISIVGGTEKNKFDDYKGIFYNLTNSILFEDQYVETQSPIDSGITDDFTEYVDKFYREINAFGIYKARPKNINIRLESLDTLEKTAHYHGVSFGYKNDEKIEIVLNKGSWNSFTKAQKHYLIFHELCHDVLNLDDLSATAYEKHIMYPSIHNYKDLTMDDFIHNLHNLLENY